MITLERYVFRRFLLALVLVFVVLLATVWTTQAVRVFNLVTVRGQTFLVFFELTLLILPTLVPIIAPIAVAIGVIYTLNSLNDGSELAIINAAGGTPSLLMRPITAVSLAMTAFIAINTVAIVPANQRGLRDFQARINTNILTSVIRDGQFIDIGDGLTIHIRRRNTDNSLDRIFVSDRREKGQVVVYTARRGAIVSSPSGTFLVMQDGVIQRQNQTENSISMIEFRSYAFDLSTFTAGGRATTYGPIEQPTSYLLNPDPNDSNFQQYPGRYRAELHDRLSSPLYALVFAFLPLALLGDPRTARQRSGGAIATCAALLVIVREAGYLLVPAVNADDSLVPLLYLLPLGTVLICLAVVFGLLRPHLPRRMARMIERSRLAGALRRPDPTAAES